MNEALFSLRAFAYLDRDGMKTDEGGRRPQPLRWGQDGEGHGEDDGGNHGDGDGSHGCPGS